MWFELIPSGTIVMVCLAIPSCALWGLHKVFLGNAYARKLDYRWDRIMYTRDKLLTGDAYKCLGLEAIPDEGAPIEVIMKEREWPKYFLK